MKWTTKQMNKLGFSKSESVKAEKETTSKKASRHSFDTENKWTAKDFRDPVAASKLSRSKTDVH